MKEVIYLPATTPSETILELQKDYQIVFTLDDLKKMESFHSNAVALIKEKTNEIDPV